MPERSNRHIQIKPFLVCRSRTRHRLLGTEKVRKTARATAVGRKCICAHQSERLLSQDLLTSSLAEGFGSSVPRADIRDVVVKETLEFIHTISRQSHAGVVAHFC